MIELKEYPVGLKGYAISVPLDQEMRVKIIGTAFLVNECVPDESLFEISYEVNNVNDVEVLKETLYFKNNSSELSIGSFMRDLNEDISPVYCDITKWIGLEGTIVLDTLYREGTLYVYVKKRQFDINDESYDGHNDNVPYMRLTRR